MKFGNLFLLLALLSASLIYAGGNLNVSSTPSGATVRLDNQVLGNTPLLARNISTGNHTLRLNKTGYQDYSTNVNIQENRTTVVNATLDANGTLNVTTVPNGAGVYINGQRRGSETPMTLILPVGNYQVSLRKNGYNNYNTNVNIQQNRVTVLNATLNRSQNVTGNLSIDSVPREANFVATGPDGFRASGTTRQVLRNLALGTYTVELTMEGYQSARRTVQISGFVNYGITVRLTRIQNLSNGTLNVTTNPSSAQLYIDDRYAALTPSSTRLAEGNHAIRLTKAGYQNYNTNVNIIANRLQTLNVTLNRSPVENGTLNVTTRPDGALVYVDNQLRGWPTPTSISLLQGNHAIRITKEGYRAHSTSVNIVAGRLYALNVTLNQSGNRSPADQAVQPGGSLYIRSSPSGASVYLNDELKGRTPLTIRNLQPGDYSLKVAKINYLDEETSARVSSGQQASLTVSLEKIPTRTASKPAATVALPASGTPSVETPESTAPANTPSTAPTQSKTSQTKTTSLVTSSFTTSDEMEINMRCMLLGC